MVKQEEHVRVSKNGIPFKAGSRHTYDCPWCSGKYETPELLYDHMAEERERSEINRDELKEEIMAAKTKLYLRQLRVKVKEFFEEGLITKIDYYYLSDVITGRMSYAVGD